MHIPGHMIEGPVTPVTAVVSAVALAAVSYFAVKAKDKPAPSRVAAVAAFIFAAQMMNFPIQNGTSGHLLGATLATSLLGMPFGILIMGLVLAIQSLVFSDGGITVLGANILNMALIGSLAGGVIHHLFLKKGNPSFFLLGFAAWLSVVLAALACSLELAFSGTIQLTRVLPAMIGIHAIIGIGEAVITVAAFWLFSSSARAATGKKSFGIPLVSALVIGLVLSPFASGFPDGLEWVAEKYNFLHASAPAFVAPLGDYSFPLISNPVIATGLAGISGVLITFAVVYGAAALIKRSAKARTL